MDEYSYEIVVLGIGVLESGLSKKDAKNKLEEIRIDPIYNDDNVYMRRVEKVIINRQLKWSIKLDDNWGCFLLGANANIGDGHCYFCIYLGFKTLVVGKDYF